MDGLAILLFAVFGLGLTLVFILEDILNSPNKKPPYD